jgi:uncharacterized membrane protein YkvA (DUF1232 family)
MIPQWSRVRNDRRGVDMTDSWASTFVLALGIGLLLYLTFIVLLIMRGRKQDARAWAGFIPDCVLLGKRLLADPTVPRRAKIVVALLVAYLVLPVDLVPDFIPVAGQADDALVAALALRYALRYVSIESLKAHWPGPATSLQLVLRLAGKPARQEQPSG